MPGRDGTGPMGTGPIGRRMGPCFRNTTPVEQSVERKEDRIVYGVGRGGRPRGCGMGFCGGRRGRRY